MQIPSRLKKRIEFEKQVELDRQKQKAYRLAKEMEDMAAELMHQALRLQEEIENGRAE